VKLEVYYDTTLEVATEKDVSGLAGMSSAVLTFGNVFHPTRTRSAGRYALKASVDNDNEVEESDETNNMHVQNDFAVTVIGDANGDKTVNILDAVKLSLAWISRPSDPQWNIHADINHDGKTDILDAVRIDLHWGDQA
jgi:hypothetical protein